MLDILTITGPIYLCIAAGYASVRWGMFSKVDMRVFGQFVMQIALPALLFNALASRPLAEVMHPAYLLTYTVGSLAVLLGAIGWSRRLQGKGLTESAYMAMGMTCANSGYVGYPVMLLLFGPLAGVILALNLIVENLIKLPLLFTLADAGAHVGDRPSAVQVVRQTVVRLARNPMIVAIVLGFLVSLMGWPLPSVIGRTVNLFAAASGGLALFIIGGNLVGLPFKGIRRQVGCHHRRQVAVAPVGCVARSDAPAMARPAHPARGTACCCGAVGGHAHVGHLPIAGGPPRPRGVQCSRLAGRHGSLFREPERHSLVDAAQRGLAGMNRPGGR